MSYPNVPTTGRVYPMFSSFDARYMLPATRAMITRADGPMEVMMFAPAPNGQSWLMGVLQTTVSEGGGRLDVSSRTQFPQRIGKRYNFVVVSQGGIPPE